MKNQEVSAMDPLGQSYEHKAGTIIQNLKKRQIAGVYLPSADQAREYILSCIPDGATVSWGGSMTVDALGVKQELAARNLTCLDRALAADDQEVQAIYRQAFSADFYLTGSNAITIDGKLVNIDATGNRVAALIFGPKKVFVCVGMNKVVSNEQEAISRVRDQAAPPNVNRLGLKTPCATTGVCGHCHSVDCICCQTVITRHSRQKGRIEVILIGEALGY